jgi:hypothetical protein
MKGPENGFIYFPHFLVAQIKVDNYFMQAIQLHSPAQHPSHTPSTKLVQVMKELKKFTVDKQTYLY